MTILKPVPGRIVQTKVNQSSMKPKANPANVSRPEVKKAHDLSISEESSDLSSDDSNDSSSEDSSNSYDSDSGTDGESETSETSSDGSVHPPRSAARDGESKSAKSSQGQSLIAAGQPEELIQKPRRELPGTICLSHCRYEVVRNVARKYGLRELNEDEQWDIYWTDFSVTIEQAVGIKRFQIMNHFPGMNEICRKDLLAKNLNRMKKLFGKDYDIFPKTWNLPSDFGELQNYARGRRNKIYICKPEMGCQGRGIFLIRNIKDLNPVGKIVCQLYIARPFLIDNYKFDLRLYVLITSTDPFRIYVHKEGMARFATAKYKPLTNNMDTENSYMHLTNYTVNKCSRDYIVDDDCGSKRRLTSVWKWLSEHGHNVKSVCEEIDDVIIKTIFSAGMMLKQTYKYCFPDRTTASACFEILGFDIIFDHALKPHVLEVNHSPSFHTDTKLDLEIKESLLKDTFAMLNLKKLDRKKFLNEERKRVRERLTRKLKPNEPESQNTKAKQKPTHELTDPADVQFAHEVAHCGNYRLIYPQLDSEKYDPYLQKNVPSFFQETAASQARAKCIRTNIDEQNRKKLIEETKRVANGNNGTSLGKEKALLPESSLQSSKTNKVTKKAPQSTSSSFLPGKILPGEELDRLKGQINRGILVRSMGIEAQIFKLLCQNGNIKPEQEMAYARVYGNGRLDPGDRAE